MDTLYSAPQSFSLYEHHQWSDDPKSSCLGDEHEIDLSDKALHQSSFHISSESELGRNSLLKIEDGFSASATPTGLDSSQMWQEQPHDAYSDHRPVRSFSTPHTLVMNGSSQHFMRPNDPALTVQHPTTWPMTHSGTSTPTPLYGPVYDMTFNHSGPTFSSYGSQPVSAVSMSPQSSQGGWASATSSDGPDRRGMISPIYRPTSPGTVMRPDGIRKKNARFEIPKERNLANIDAMILASNDETEKKELKQQKRLLRNRQAALDSRQRKKTHTEKLEQEKKVSDKKMYDLEEGLTRLESTLSIEREQFMQQHQHLENVIHALQYERDEAIRTKTLETAELRRQNNMLKECVRDLERQQHKGYAPAAGMPYSGEYNEQFALEDNWEDEFSLIDGDDLKMDDMDALQRQLTPKPTVPNSKTVDPKAEAGFSWNTFYMCLLFGAFIASNNNSTSMDQNAATAIASSIPATEASNVLKTVLGSSRSESTTNNADIGVPSAHTGTVDAGTSATADLDHLHQSLSAPSRRQEIEATFSMSASSYQHVTDPFNEHLNVDATHKLLESDSAPEPSALQKAFATMQAQKDNIDKITGMGSKARERSLLWDQVPPEVIKNFEAMVHGHPITDSTEGAEQ